MAIGTVKFFNAGKGFGFITPDGGAKDVFVPSASIATAGVALLKTGQRVSFEEMPDAKGPKAVNLKLLESPPKPVPENRPAPQMDNRAASQADSKRVTLYCDPSQEDAEDILAGLRDAGHEPLIVDYIADAPTRDELKTLASLLRGTDQSLVRRYEHLFHELRLDDRFISENDFWDAIVEHPALINGPVVAFASRAAICRSPEALKAFLAPPVQGAAGQQRKSLSPALLKLMGRSPVPQNDAVIVAPDPVPETMPAPVQPAQEPAPVKLAAKVKTKPAPKPEPKAKAATKPKVAAKAKVVKKAKR